MYLLVISADGSVFNPGSRRESIRCWKIDERVTSEPCVFLSSEKSIAKYSFAIFFFFFIFDNLESTGEIEILVESNLSKRILFPTDFHYRAI